MVNIILITVLGMIAAATADPLVVSSSVYPGVYPGMYASMWPPSAALQALPAVSAAVPPVVSAATLPAAPSSLYWSAAAYPTNTPYNFQSFPVIPEVASPLLSYTALPSPYDAWFYKR